MTNARAAEVLCIATTYNGCGRATSDELKEAISIAYNALRNSSLRKKGEWVSVEDRLPDLIPCNAGTAYSEAVIIWTTGRKAMVAVFDGDDFICASDFWDADGEEATHWMPLPEPPEKGA